MRYKITRDIKSITVRVAFLIVREPMKFLNKPLTKVMSRWMLNRCETLAGLYELKELLDQTWLIERMQMARIKIEENNMLIRKEQNESAQVKDAS